MRPLSQGPGAIREDIKYLMRCLHRVQQDPKRHLGRERNALIAHLKGALAILTAGSDRTEEPVRKSA